MVKWVKSRKKMPFTTTRLIRTAYYHSDNPTMSGTVFEFDYADKILISELTGERYLWVNGQWVLYTDPKP